jgi:hypothetical protein
MRKKQHAEFVANDLVGDHLIEETILEEALPEDDAIDALREHPEREQPGVTSGRGSRVRRPPRSDPRHTDQSVLPGRDDMPAGSERPSPSGSS